MGSSAKTGKKFSVGHRSSFWIKLSFGIGHPPSYTSTAVYMCGGGFKGPKSSNRIQLSRFIQKAFLVISLCPWSPWSPHCPCHHHIVPVIPMSSPCHPHHPHIIPIAPEGPHVVPIAVVSVVSTLCCPHCPCGPHVIPVVSTSSPSSPCHVEDSHIIPNPQTPTPPTHHPAGGWGIPNQ